MSGGGPTNPSADAIRVTLAPASSHLDLPPAVVAAADARLERSDGRHAVLLVDGGATHRVMMEVVGPPPSGGRTRHEVVVDGWRFELDAELESRASLRDRARRGAAAGGAAGPLDVRAVIPGRILAVSVAPGEQVRAGQALLVIEAMKMQNEVRASRDGVVARVEAAPGSTVDVGDLLAVLE